MKIGIIGGKGIMGRVFSSLFEEQGLECLISDIGTDLTNQDLAKQTDVVLVSVPITESIKVIESLCLTLNENQLLADLTSVKEGPVNAMLKSKAEVLGLHPMFGSGLKSLKGQTVIFCPARKKDKTDFFLNILKNAELNLKETTPEIHDKMMSVVQTLNHISSVILAATMAELGTDIFESLEYASPAYKIRLQLLARLMGESDDLYAGIAFSNANNDNALELLRQKTEEMLEIYKNKDFKSFGRVFNNASEYFGELRKSGTEYSNKLIEYISKI